MIGIDILENERIAEKAKKPEFIKQILTDNEQKYINSFSDITERVTGLFCVKEAVKKAFGCPVKMDFKSFEIRHFENGKPYVIFDKSLSSLVDNKVVEISLSHSKTVSVAVAIVFDKDMFCYCNEQSECHCQNGEKCTCDDECDDKCHCDDDKCTCNDDCKCKKDKKE